MRIISHPLSLKIQYHKDKLYKLTCCVFVIDMWISGYYNNMPAKKRSTSLKFCLIFIILQKIWFNIFFLSIWATKAVQSTKKRMWDSNLWPIVHSTSILTIRLRHTWLYDVTLLLIMKYNSRDLFCKRLPVFILKLGNSKPNIKKN